MKRFSYIFISFSVAFMLNVKIRFLLFFFFLLFSFFFFNCDSLHARLSSHSEAWSYKKKKHKKTKAYKKSV